jgi:hypothetical protein
MRLGVFLKTYLGFIIISFYLMTTGCVVESVSGGASLTDAELENPFDYPGCVSGQGVGTNTIQVDFLFPTEATRVRLKRNGNIVAEFSQANQTTSHIDDSGLREGATYLYTCEAYVDGIWSEGTNALQLSTIAVNAPVFSGILNAVSQSANSVLVTWNASLVDLPVRAYSYKVYANVGDTVNWTIPPRATVLQGSPSQALISGLGDELSYSFGVRACSEGDVCETNVIQKVVVTPNGGAPTTPGVSALAIQAGQLNITAPWVETNGGIVRRYIYLRSGPTGGLNIGDYTLVKTYQITGVDLFSPPQNLSTTSIQEGLTYHVIVQDEDPSGLRSAVTTFQTIVVSDISPPSFGGITDLVLGPQPNSTLVLSWTAIPTEVADPTNGGLKYQIYSLTNTQPIVTNPCSFGSLVTELNVSAYTAGATSSYTMTGLNEKSYYSVCIKAIDTAGNKSFNNNFIQTNTLDTTAPIFSGIQALGFDNQTGSLTASWNSSPSVDIKEYKLTIWKNQPTPPAVPLELFRTHASSATGTTVSSAEFAINDGDQVLMIVEACDTTESPFGTQNCSSTGIQRAIVLPDVTPPQNFLGIKGPSFILTPTEGSFTVAWNAPASWSDYRGFRVYNVNTADNSLTLMKTCPCSGNNCPDMITQCTINGLDAYRTYRLHVRAYDAVNNETVYLNPATNYSNKRTSDTTAPTFASNLLIGAAPNFTLTWNTALDNQYGLEPGVQLRYEVYQNNGPFDFTIPTQPDGNLKATTSLLSFQDSGFVEGQTYYYTVCAKDSSNNKHCDQITRTISVPDVTKPIITKLVSNKTVKAKVWDLSWDMQDNITTTPNLVVEIRRRVSATGELATNSDEVVYSGLGSDLIVSGNSASTSMAVTLDRLSGPADSNTKINYLVSIKDQQGNEATSNVTVSIDNTLQVTSVKSQSGPIGGGKTVVVYGKGFTKSTENRVSQDTTVTIGGRACTSLVVLSDSALHCISPTSLVSGSVEVRVKNKINIPVTPGNEIYSEAFLTNGYTYSDTLNICDTPGLWGPSFASGTGANELNPYVICNLTHLNNVRSIATSGSYYKLGENLDLTAASFNPLGTSVAKFTGFFDGDGHVIMNWTYNNPQTNVGLFGYVNGSFQITNLGLVNVNLTATQSLGALIGVAEGGTNITSLISNVFVTGVVIGTDFVGGLIGRKQSPHVNFNVVNSYFIGQVTASGTTGYGGGIAGFLGTETGGYFQNVYSEGSITGAKILGGLFGNLGQSKQVTSSFSRATVTASENFAGGIAGELKAGGSITNSYVEEGSVSGVDSVGGIVGLSEGTVSGSTSKVSVTSTGRRGGGLVGYSNGGSVINSHSEKNQNVNNSGGGLIGEALNTTVTNSYALGDVISNGTDVGGLIGKVSLATSISATISKVYSTGFVNTISSAVGGLIGTVDLLSNSHLVLDQAFSRSQVGSDFTLSNQQYGGLIGKINTTAGSTANITNCFASGSVYAGNYAGGLIGGYDNEGGTISVSFCYSASPILGGSLGRGGIFGRSSNTLHTISDTYWDTDVSSKAFASGSGSYVGTASGYTTVNMLDYGNSIYVGWNFSTIWLIPTSGYPKLMFE